MSAAELAAELRRLGPYALEAAAGEIEVMDDRAACDTDALAIVTAILGRRLQRVLLLATLERHGGDLARVSAALGLADSGDGLLCRLRDLDIAASDIAARTRLRAVRGGADGE